VNLDFPDPMYVEALIGPETVDTMPAPTIRAFQDRGRVAETLTHGMRETQLLLDELVRAGVVYDDVVSTLEREGVQRFVDSFADLLEVVDERRRALAAAR
jgi:transaldolase